MLQKIEIEDTSDCATCTKRDADAWEMLTTARCDVLEQCQCPECGRWFSLLIYDEAMLDADSP